MNGFHKIHKFILFEITNNCNLSCPYCYIQKEERTIDFEIVKKIYLLNPYFNILSFFGGEPFLYPEYMLEIIKLFKKAKHFTFGVVTNGSLLTKKDILYWIGKGISTWKISIHRNSEIWLLEFFEDLKRRLKEKIDVRFVKFFQTIYDFEKSEWIREMKKYKYIQFSAVFPFQKNSFSFFYKPSKKCLIKHVNTKCNFNIYVDIDGFVYPCLKIHSQKYKCYGNIKEDFEKIDFACKVFSNVIKKCEIAQLEKNRGITICELFLS